MNSEKSFIDLIEQSIKRNWDADALTDYKGATLQYKDVARKIEKIHIILEESGVKKGDKNTFWKSIITESCYLWT